MHFTSKRTHKTKPYPDNWKNCWISSIFLAVKYFLKKKTFKYSAWVNVLSYISPLPKGRKGSNPNRLRSKNYTILTFKNLKLSYLASITLASNTRLHTHTHTYTHTPPHTHKGMLCDLSRLVSVNFRISFDHIQKDHHLFVCMHDVKTCTVYTHMHAHTHTHTHTHTHICTVTFLRHKKRVAMFLNKCIVFQKIIVCCVTCTHV